MIFNFKVSHSQILKWRDYDIDNPGHFHGRDNLIDLSETGRLEDNGDIKYFMELLLLMSV